MKAEGRKKKVFSVVNTWLLAFLFVVLWRWSCGFQRKQFTSYACRATCWDDGGATIFLAQPGEVAELRGRSLTGNFVQNIDQVPDYYFYWPLDILLVRPSLWKTCFGWGLIHPGINSDIPASSPSEKCFGRGGFRNNQRNFTKAHTTPPKSRQLFFMLSCLHLEKTRRTKQDLLCAIVYWPF